MFGLTAEARPGLDGHIFISPVDPSQYMAMLCYKNGSLAREALRDQHQAALAASTGPSKDASAPTPAPASSASASAASWDAFGAALARTAPGNGGNMGVYFLAPEITPSTGDRSGIFRFDATGTSTAGYADPATDIRAVVEGQFLSMRVYSESIGISNPKRLIVTGGASMNPQIVQVIK